MTNTIADTTEQSDLMMVVGWNPEAAHPVYGMRIRQAVDKGTQLIVVDPRDTDLSKKADAHVRLKPGTNTAFVNGLMNVIISEGLQDQDFIAERTENFDALAEVVAKYTPEYVAEICEVPADLICHVARLYATAPAAAIMYCLGVTEHHTGTEGVMSLSNLAMLCGKLGRPGCGVNPVRGQNNVQGACDMGCSPNVFSGYQGIDKPGVVEKFEEAWGVELPREIGTKATDCFPKMISGEIKGLFLFGEDPVRTDPNTHHVIKALESLDFMVVDDLFMTETAKYADVILPGRSYAEKEGTFSNTERRVQRVRKAVTVAGDTRPDTWIFTEVMNRMGYEQPHMTPARIMEEIASVTPSFAGISHARLDSEEVAGRGLQWPCTSPEHPGTPIMHVDKFARGKGLFRPAEYEQSTEMPDAEYPTMLMTGRILYHYNASAMTDKTEGLNQIASESFVQINTDDAAEWGIEDGQKVRVSSRRGQVEVRADVSGMTNRGQVWMPFHFVEGNANWLTNDSLDGISATPEYKVCAVKVEPIA